MLETLPTAYVLCGTPRTGSTLLCALLESTGVAGRPNSYFRSPSFDEWATAWHLPRTPQGQVTFADYLRGALAAGRSANGVFAVRIMWGTMDEVVHDLRTLYADDSSVDRDLLVRAFGPTQFIYLERRDHVAQAVSRARAEQTNRWHSTDAVPVGQPASAPHYNFAQIHGYVQEIAAHNAAWRAWFGAQGIQPYLVWYEDLAAAPVPITRALLDVLRIAVPPHVAIHAPQQRLADQLSAAWIAHYHADVGTP